jgi:hypothetical protein
MFRVAAASPLGSKRGTGRGGFIDSVLAALDGFYELVVQELRAWVARAPQLPAGGRLAAEEAGIDIEPPARDLLEDPGAVSDATPEETEGPPDVVITAVDDASDEAPKSDTPPPAAPGALEMISWDSAQDKLDQERSEFQNN